jgi:hypothetical protein
MNPLLGMFGALKGIATPAPPVRAFLGVAVVSAFATTLTMGSAQAATSTTCAALLGDPGISLTTGDKTITNIVCSGDVAGSSDVLINFGVNGPIYEFSSDIINAGTGADTSGGISYTIAINSDQAFKSVALTAAGFNFEATKQIFNGTTLLATLDVGDVTSFAANQFFQSLNIVDTWTVGTGEFATLQDINNLYTQKPARGPSEVPGPLPILGVGAAYGLSRKLRARLRQASPSA